MRKTILTGMILILMLLLLPSCAAGVSQEEYDRVSSDLAAAQTQIQSLQADLTKEQAQIQSLQADLDKAQAQIQSLQSGAEAAEKKPVEALAYAEYLDVIMYPVWKEAGLTPRFVFESDFEWMVELSNRASNMGDTELTSYVKRLEKRDEAAMTELWDYCLDRIEKALKSGAEAAEKKPVEALAYAEYLDVLMYPVWKEAGLTPRFVFEDDFEWMVELSNRASNIGDTELTSYVKRLEKRDEAAMTELWDYCLDRIEKALK